MFSQRRSHYWSQQSRTFFFKGFSAKQQKKPKKAANYSVIEQNALSDKHPKMTGQTRVWPVKPTIRPDIVRWPAVILSPVVSLVELMLSGQAMDGAGWHEGALCMAVGQSALVCPCPYCVYLNKGCFGHWALRTGKLLFGIHSSKSLQWVSYAQTLYCQWTITKATFNESGIYCNGCRPFCGEVSKKFFRPLGGWERALPLDPPLNYRTVPSALVLLFWLSLVSMSNSFP